MSDVAEADLVLEGGGVKGIGLVGALSVLEERGLKPKRVAGSSAGAIVGSFVAAGFSSSEMQQIMDAADYQSFEDKTVWDHLGPPGRVLSAAFELGEYRGDEVHHWITSQLASKAVTTFSSMPYVDDGADPALGSQQYRLVVMASDISAGRLRRLPWDAEVFGESPGDMPVADAVRASMSIPFFFKPVKKSLPGGGDAVLVDGGMLSNFPITTFDRTDGKPPRWPTIGIKLSARPETGEESANPVSGVFSMGKALLATMTGWYDNMHLDDPATVARTIFVDTTGVKATDFDLDDATKKRLYDNGRKAATQFLDGGDGREAWNWETYQQRYPSSSPTG